MSPASLPANVQAREILASLKSGALLTGTVRSHSMEGSTAVAWIAIRLGAMGERQVLVKGEAQLRPGQQVVIQCVPDPLRPDHYRFHLAPEGAPRPTARCLRRR
jgi:hypothetical protein